MAGVTRGALYHHFASKTEVAAAVVAEIEDELVERVVAAAVRGRGLRDQLQRGCRAYVEACADPTMARILADAPAVLGIEACRALDAAACVPLLAERLRPGRGGGRGGARGSRRRRRPAPGLPQRGGGIIAAAPHDRALRRGSAPPWMPSSASSSADAASRRDHGAPGRLSSDR